MYVFIGTHVYNFYYYPIAGSRILTRFVYGPTQEISTKTRVIATRNKSSGTNDIICFGVCNNYNNNNYITKMSISIKRPYFALTSRPRSTLDSRSDNNNIKNKDSNCKCTTSQRTHPHNYQCHHKHIPHTAHWCCTVTRPSFFSILLMSLLLLSAHWHSAEAKPKSRKSSNSHHSNDEKSPTEGQRFAMEPQDQTAVVGSRVTLPCRVMGKMGALQWTKDDFGLGQHRNLSGFERYSMVGSDEEGDFSLDIYPVMLDDDAKYQCQVGPGPAGEAGIRSRFAELTVLVPPEAPKITQGEVIFTTEDREIELECVSAGGKPAAEVSGSHFSYSQMLFATALAL